MIYYTTQLMASSHAASIARVLYDMMTVSLDRAFERAGTRINCPGTSSSWRGPDILKCFKSFVHTPFQTRAPFQSTIGPSWMEPLDSPEPRITVEMYFFDICKVWVCRELGLFVINWVCNMRYTEFHKSGCY